MDLPLALPATETGLSTLPRPASSGKSVLARQGCEFEAGVNQRVSHSGFSGMFDPQWTDNASRFDTAAYALYRFYLPDYAGEHACRLSWATVPDNGTQQWIGLSNWKSGRWDWYPGSASGVVDLSAAGVEQYIRGSTARELLLVVLVLGVQQCYLRGICFGDGAIADNWPQFGHDARHTHRAIAPGPETPERRWRYRTAGAVASSLACGNDGTVYNGCSDGSVYAINPDCTVRWRFTAGAPVRSSPEVLPDGTIYVGCDDGSLYAIAPDGKLQWAFATGGSVFSSPVIGYDGTVYFGSDDAGITAVSQHGELVWRYATGGPVLSSAAVADDGTVYVGSDDGYVYALTHAGALAWRFATLGPVRSSPAIAADGIIFAGSADGNLYAIQPDGKELWHYACGGSIGLSSPALSADGLVYIGAADGCLYAIDTDRAIGSADLRLKWRFQTEAAIESSPAIDGLGRVFFGSLDGGIYCVASSGATGASQLWRYDAAAAVASSPALSAGGLLFVGCDDGAVYSFGPPVPCPPYALLVVTPNHPNPDEPVAFDGSGSYDPDGTLVKYEWDWTGDGSWDFDSGADAVVEHAYSDQEWGNIPVRLRVTDDAGMTATQTAVINVNAAPQALFMADPVSGVPPLLVFFDALGSDPPDLFNPPRYAYDPDGQIVNYEWNFDDGGGWHDYDMTPVAFYTFTEYEVYVVQLRVTDDDGAAGIGMESIWLDPDL